MCSNFFLTKAKRCYIIQKILDLKENVLVRLWILFQKRIFSIFMGTLVGKRKQTIFKKRWFDIIMARFAVGARESLVLYGPVEANLVFTILTAQWVLNLLLAIVVQNCTRCRSIFGALSPCLTEMKTYRITPLLARQYLKTW